MKTLILLAAAIAVAAAQQNNQYTTPVPILKQINKHNEDGSYSYGYEAADGSFKIESKYPNGEVYGKYGYVDDTGKVREIEYGATNRGFEPAGNGINVPPPTLSNNQAAIRPLAPGEEDDGQYREDPSVYYKDEKYNQPIARQPNAIPQQSRFQWNSPASQPAPAFRPQTNWNQGQSQWQQPQAYQAPQPQAYRAPQPQWQQPQPQWQQPQYRSNYVQPVNPAFPNFNQFGGHPATNIDINTGSYSVQYKR